MVGDLHCHTNFSDGSTDYKDILNYGKRIGLDYIAVTDHDTLEETDNIIYYGKEIGINVIKGVEVSCKDPDTKNRVHLLCYLPHNEKILSDFVDGILKKRNEVGLYIIEKLLKDYPLSEKDILKYTDKSKCIYKSHIMRAFLDYGYDNTIYGDFFKYIFRENREKYAKSIDYPSVYDAIDVIKKSGSVCIVAHPPVYKTMDLTEKLAKNGLIDGVELNHPQNNEKDKKIIKGIAEKYSLIETGGTDFHGFCSSRNTFPLGSFVTNHHNLQKLFEKSRNLK